MKTLTNELMINCNFKEIDKEFDFFQFRSSGKYISRGSKILDLGLGDIRSIAFDDGASAFIMTKKYSYKTFELQGMIDDDSIGIKKLDASEIKPYILSRLFLFNLANSEYDDFSFENRTGKLYLFNSEWISKNRKTLKALNIDIKSLGGDTSKIIASACSFSSAKLFKSQKINEAYPRYVFSIKNSLKRTFNKNDDAYIKKAYKTKKAEIPFISFGKNDKALCKAFLLLTIIEEFNRRYTGLIEIQAKEKEIIKKIDAKRDEHFFLTVMELLIGKTIYLTNMDKVQEDIKAFEVLVERIQELLPLTNIEISDKIVSKELNIVLIHNKEYYKEYNLKDPYTDFDRSTPIQCVTLEDACNKDSDVIYKTIIKELQIKNEIINLRKFVIDNWQSFNYTKPWIFGMMADNESFFMKVMPTGDFKLIKKSSVFSSYKEDIFNNLEKVMHSIKNEEKMIVSDEDGNINVIYNSGFIPLPREGLFKTKSPRNKESRNENLSGVLDINSYEGGLQYSVGPVGKGVNISIPSAPNIYDIKVQSGKNIIFDLIETMGVQFVKYNNYTVLPYPFKYLREWILMSNLD